MILTPLATTNRPGLSALVYRVGTFSTFFQTMLSRLSSEDFPALAGLTARTPDDASIALLDGWAAVLDVLTFYQERVANEGYLRTAVERASVVELARLTGYTPAPGVAASVYLTYTMDKNQSVTIPAGSRAQSMGAQGVLPQSFETTADLDASDTYNSLGIRKTQPALLAADTAIIFVDGTANNIRTNDVLLLNSGSGPAMRRVASVELQTQGNQTKITLQAVPAQPPVVSNANAANAIKASAPATPSAQVSPPAKSGDVPPPARPAFTQLMTLLPPLLKLPAAHPPTPQDLVRNVAQSFTPQSDTAPSLLKMLNPVIEPQLDAAFRNAPALVPLATQAYVMRVKAGPFGSGAPLRFVAPSVQSGGPGTYQEWDLQRTVAGVNEAFQLDAQITPLAYQDASINVGFSITLGPKTFTQPAGTITQSTPMTVDFKDAGETITVSLTRSTDAAPNPTVVFALRIRGTTISVVVQTQSVSVTGVTLTSTSLTSVNAISRIVLAGSIPSTGTSEPTESPNVLCLDATYDQIQPGTLVALVGPRSLIATATQVAVVSRADYGLVGRVSQLTLSQNWIDPAKDSFADIRNTTVYAQADTQTLREETIVGSVSGQTLELDGLYTGLQSGRWLIVQGQRVDLPGVTSAELVMLSGVDQDVKKDDKGVPRPGEKVHSFLKLASPLSYTYQRDSVTIQANVVPATHGESRNEVIGSGDASQTLQTFALHQKPLTYVSAPTASGIRSTLSVQVNNVVWSEAANLLEMGPQDREYLVSTDDSGTASVVFGDGIHGLRAPTGSENIKAAYRSGIGVVGNVDAGAISLLATRPLGVRAVLNPLASSGGADPETRDQARANVPMGLSALNRLVSVEDYQDFSRAFAGVSKSSATLMPAGAPLVFVTIAGAEGFPVVAGSDLLVNLTNALQTLGDPTLPVLVASCDLLLIVISANVAMLPGYLWDDVQPAIRAAVLGLLSFANRSLAQDVLASEVIAAIQGVEGVAYLDMKTLAAMPRDLTAADLDALTAASAVPDRIAVNDARFGSAGIILPAQLAYLSPDIADLLILNSIQP